MSIAFRAVSGALAARLDSDFTPDDSRSVLFAGSRCSSRMTESYFLSKRLSGGLEGAVRFYPSRNMRAQVESCCESHLKMGSAFTLERVLRIFGICLNSPALLKGSLDNDAYESFLRLKAEAAKGEGRNGRLANELIASMRKFLLGRIAGGGIGVEDVREIAVFLSQSLSNSMCRCVVIEDLEDSLAPAKNALLKTLEEPFGRSVIILVSKRPSALPKTILSRTARYNFLPIAQKKREDLLGMLGDSGDWTEFENANLYGDAGALKQIHGAASAIYGYLKSPSESKRPEAMDAASRVLRKGFSAFLSPSEAVEALLDMISKKAEADFLACDGEWMPLFSGIEKTINRARADLAANVPVTDIVSYLLL